LVYGVLGSCLFFGGSASTPLSIGLPVSAQTNAQSLPPVPDVVTQLSERFEAIARKVSPAVVSVEAVKPPKTNPVSGKGKATEESGSGVIVQVEGRTGYLVLTNNHVVAQARPEQITVHLSDGRIFRPGRVWADPETDIALLSLDGAVHLPVAVLGDSDTAKVGHWVLAIGSPFGLNQTVTHGIISARERGQVSLGNAIRIKDFLQTDAAINPGSSGGPLLDMRGDVIGLNTAIASHNGSSSGVAFSIPSNLVKRVVKQMLTQGAVARGYLGMQLALSFEPAEALKLGLDRLRGALVDRVYADTPAAAAGLQARDVILQVDNIAIKNENHLINLIASLPPGQRVRLQAWRERNVISLDALVGDWGQAQSRFRAEP
jgi:S1-C subfamily serine protease